MFKKLIKFLTPQPVIEQENDYIVLKNRIESFNSNLFIGFNSNKNNGKEIRSQYKTIDEYNSGLRYVLAIINHEKIYSGNIVLAEDTIPIVDFFLTKDKKYLDEEVYVEEFIHLINEYFYIINLVSNTNEEIRNRKLFNYTNSLLNTFNDLNRFQYIN